MMISGMGTGTDMNMGTNMNTSMNMSTGTKTGSCAMTGFTSSTSFMCSVMMTICSVMMTVSALYQATGRYAIRCLQRVVNLVPATVCLALGLAPALVFSSAVGAVAQDTTGPVGVFELPASHDGITPFTAVIVFDEEPKRIWPLELVGLLIRGSTDPETQTQPVQIYTNTDHAPLITNRRKDDNDKRRYLFDVTPRAPVDIRFRLSGGYMDVAGNVGPTISSPAIPYVAPAGGNNQPEANAGPDQVVDPGDTVTLDGSESSDRDGNETITYSWARTGGTTGVTAPTLTGSTTDSPTFTADTLTSGDDDVVHVFTLTVTDDHDETDTDTMTVTVEAPDTNPAPIASAGVDQEVISGALVTLDGSASGDDGRIVSWAWERTGGTEGLDATVPLNNRNAIKPTFTANTLAVGGGDVIHIFTLIVTDNEGATGIDTVTVTIKAPLFAAPVANAGPDQTFDPGATVTLDGRGSTFDSRRTPLDYAWKRTGGTADPVTLAGADTAMPTFTAVAPALLPSTPFATHIFELTVTDSAGEISTDTVTVWIVIPTARSAPVANAGMDRTVTSRAAVRLDGSGSTVHSSRTIRSYAWRWVKQLSTPNVEAITLTDPNTAMPGFTAPTLAVGAKDITHVFELTVTDSAGQTNIDTVSITVIFPFANPVANAGQDRKVGSGTVVTLDGSDSTVDLRRPDASKSYAWARTGGNGDDTVTLTSETTAKPSFMAETLASNATDVTHIFTLTVTDSAGGQHTDTVTITVTLGNADPVANAGDDQPAVVSGTTVTLDGSRSSDSDGSISKFAWARTGGTGDASITLSSDSVAEPTFRAEILQTGAADVTHIFTLTVTDDDQATATDTVTITVTPANAVPIANAGQDRTVDPATMVQLDGSDSLDIDGRIVSWAWARTGGTAGGSATLTDAMTARPTFTSDVLQMDDDDVIHIFTLTVTDDDGGIDTATVTITVSFGDTVPPTGRFEAVDGGPVPYFYGNKNPFKLALVFDEAVTVSGNDVTAAISDETPIDDRVAFKNRTPTITDFGQEGIDGRRYIFTVTPRDTGVPSFRITLRGRNYQDSAGNRGVADIATAPILYVDPTVTNTAPVADAGDEQTVDSGMRNVQLDGTGSSDTEGEIRTYAWARTGGTAGGSVTLSDKNAAQPTFTADTLDPGGPDVTHEFTLTVTDMSRHEIREETRRTDPDTGDITTTIETNPVPSACRDGRASDEHCTLAYRNSAEDTVTVTVDAPPLADAGDDQTAGSAALVTLDGSGSIDRNTTNLTYAWERTGGTTGGTVTLTGANTNMPTFTADTLAAGAADVIHTFTLTVTDSRSQSHTDTVTVTVSNPNADPVANAGPDREVLAGTVVTLNGSGSSDSDGDDTITTYSWARTGGTEGVAAPTLAATAQPTFTADTLTPGDADVIHIFTLTVTDNAGAMDTDTVTITVVAEDTTRPEGTFVSSASHDGATSFTVELIFNEEVEFSKGDLQMLLVGVPAQNLGSNPRFHYDLDTHEPTRSGFAQDPNNELRYTFSVTPKVPLSIRIALRGRNYEDLSGNTGTNISITIPFSGPSNKRPVAEAGDDLTVASGTEVTLDGSESMDEDGTVQYYAWVRTGGTGDPLALTDADTDMPTFTPRLSGGIDDVTHIFTLWVSDNDLAISKADTVTVTVTAQTAPNVVPVADAGDDRTVQSGAPVTLDGGESSDDDGTIKSWAWTRTGGTGNASLALTNADREQSTFTADILAPGAEDVTHIFSLVVLDDVNVPSVADTVTITVNAPPLANAGSDQTSGSAALVTLDGSGSRDSNTTNLTYAWERTGGTTGGTVTLTGADTNMSTFTADTLAAGAPDVTHTFTLTVTDDEGATDTDTVTITVDAQNKGPVPNAGPDQTVASGATVTLDGRGSMDSDGFVTGYTWTFNGPDGPTLDTTDTAGIETFTAPDVAPGAPDQMLVFALSVTDNEDLSSGSGDTVTITVTPPSSNMRPIANAGTDQTVASGATVTLEGSGTDNGGTIQDYYWVKASTGTAPTLSANNVARPTLTAPTLVEGGSDVTFTYALRVKDNAGAVSDADEVTITVEAPPVANAGMDQTVAAGAPVTLDGSGSSGTIAEYQWSRESGTSTRTDVFPGASGTLTREVSRTTPTITFVADSVPANGTSVTHVFALRVFGASRISSPLDRVTVRVRPNRLPTANAGPDQSVAAGANVDLDGRGSTDNDGTIASYNWTRTEGDTTATLTGANTATPSFTAEALVAGVADTTHTFTLTVTDNNGETDTDTVTVTVIAPNAPPVAVAYVGVGASRMNTATVDSDSLVYLNAGDSMDDDGEIVTYLWERSGGTEGRSVNLRKAGTKLANFTTATLPAGAADVIHIFKLTVTDDDGEVNEDEATVTITVASPFKEPVADAGDDQTVVSGAEVELDGSGSTKDSRITEQLTYFWERTGGTTGVSVELSDEEAEQPTFTTDTLNVGDPDVIHIFTLTVEDDEGESDEDMVTITVTPPLAPLVANAGEDQSVSSGATVTLRGSGTKSDGTRMVSYNWERTSGSGMATVILNDETVLRPTFTADTLAIGASDVTHVFTLTVTDNKGSTAATDTVMITVTLNDVPPDADAGVDATVNAEETIALDGGGSTVDSRKTPLTYSWTRPVGATGTLTGANTATPSFTAAPLAPGAADVTHVFTLTVTDKNGATNADTVTITVNAPPLANAGTDATVNADETIALDGTGSSDTTGRITHAWTRSSGTGGRLTDANAETASFKAPVLVPGTADVTHVFTLTVTDKNGATNTDTVTITVNAPPLANAGTDATVNADGTIALDGTGSLDMTGPISYDWTPPVGATGMLTGANTATPSFTAASLAPGAADVTHVFTLTVTDEGATDDTVLTNADTVTITVNAPPLAVVEGEAERTVNSGASVVLDGSNSSDTTGTLAYGWTRTGGNSLIVPVPTGESTHTLTFTADTLTAGAADVTHEYTLTVTDAGATDGVRLTDDYTVMITVTSPFADPDASAVVTGGQTTITSGETITLDGSGSMTDRRRNITSYAWTSGPLGATASLTNADEAVATFTAETLTAGAPDVTHTFTLTVTDSAGASATATVMITVTSNALPIATVTGGNQIVASGAAVTLTGSGTDSDSDDDMLDYAWVRTGGTGNAAVALTGKDTKTLSFTADTLEAGARDVTHVFELVVTDDKGTESAPVEVTITIESAIAAPVARAVTDQSEYTSGAMVTLDGNGSTVDFRKTPKTHNWVRTDGTGDSNLTLTNADEAEATFTADTLVAGALDVTHTFTLTVTDSDNRTATDTVEVTITSLFADPVASAVIKGGHTTVASGETVMLDGTGSAPDRRRTITSYAWAGETPEVTADLTNADMDVATFRAETLTAGAPDVTHTFTLTVTDSAGASDTDTVTITVTSNAIPVATVTGGNQIVASEAAVTLTGSGTDSDSDDDMLDYAWVRTGGTGNAAVALTGKDTKTLRFTADALVPGAPDVTHVFELVVTDDKGTESAAVEVTITIESAIAVPVARAVTAQPEYTSGATVTLDGSGSTIDFRKTPKTHAWTGETPEVTADLTNADMAMATFTADTLDAGAPDVTHTFTLTVRDRDNRMATDTVEVTINAPFADPVANAGDDQDNIVPGTTVTLDGSGSTKDRRRTIMSYAWARTGGTTGSSATLSSMTAERPTFTANALAPGAPDVTHIFTLTVTDSAGVTDMDMVEITVISRFAPPVANAGADQNNIASGATVTLDGSGSTKDRRKTLNHTWTRTPGAESGTGGTVILSNPTDARSTFTAETLIPGARDETYSFTLTVTDGDASDTDTVTITVISPFADPVANAVTARPEVGAGDTVILDGSGSTKDRRRTITSYAWARTGGTGANVTLTGATEAMASFTADMLTAGAENVTHTFTLTVTDSAGEIATDTVEVIVTANVRPVATLTGPATLTVAAGASVTLEGSGTDRDNNVPLTYAWKRTGGTGNSAVALTGAMTTRLSFTADNLPEGADSVTHILQFVVTDNEGAESDPVTVTVTVDAPNAIPVAHAGPPPPPVASGGQIQLDGRGSSVPGGTIVAWAWTRTGGTPGVTVTLTGANTAQPTVMANDLEPGGPDETHEFTLVVTDDEGMTSVGATVMVTISAPIAAPVANAGPDQRAVSRATVRLDGRGSTPDRRKTITSYAWERTGGTGDSNLTLTGANTAQPTFTADTLNPGVDAVTHIFTLTVTDGDGTTSTDTVTVTVVSVDLRLSQSEIMVQEGGSGTYQVKLSESPRREVTIMAVSGNEDVVKLNNARLVFDGGNWNEWQEVEINSVAGSNTDDPVVIRHRLVTAGATSPVPGDVTVTLRPRADDPIPRPVGQFLQTRATALINNQPGLSSLLELDGPTPGGSFTFQATDGQLALNGGFIHNSVWGKVSGAYASSESAAGNTKSVTKSVLASFGVHRKYSEHFLAGVMLQLDLSDHERAGQVGTTDTIDGTGWLAGPYFATRHGTQPLYFEGRLLYGQSDNDIRFTDTGLGRVRTGSFDTRRLLAQIRVEGEIAMSGRNHGHDGYNGNNGDNGRKNGPRLRPYADLRWVEDRAEAFTDNIKNRVPGQSVSIGQLELGSNVEIPMAVRTGELTFIGGLGLVYSKTEGDYIPSDSRAYGRGEIGFSYDLDDNLRIDLDSFYDGIGTSRYEGYGLSLSAEMKF